MKTELERASRAREFRGVVASITASILFGIIFFLPPKLGPLSGEEIIAWRVVFVLPMAVVIFALNKQLRDVKVIWQRVMRKPALGAMLVIDAVLFAVQLWLFGWAPKHGHALDAALGYLLLPLVMVALGVVVHREKVTPLRGAAIVSAAVGVVAAIIITGSISWVTLVVAIGYPLYFLNRRHWKLDTSGAMIFELLIILPAMIYFLASRHSVETLTQSPELIPIVLILGLLSGVALTVYLAASSMLPFGLFGLLSYLEPVLLVLVSVFLLGEALTPADVFIYGPILLALAFLGAESLRKS